MSKRALTTRIAYRQLECALFWSVLSPEVAQPVIATAQGVVTVISTNAVGASWLTWPAEVDQEMTCSVTVAQLRQVRTVRGLLWLMKRSRAKVGFDHRYIMSLAELPSSAEFVMSRAEIERAVGYLDSWWPHRSHVGVDAQEGRVLFGHQSFAASISHWREREQIDFDSRFLYELFAHLLSPTVTLAIKRNGKMRMLHVTGESDGVRENHLLAGLVWKS